jgi:hypothetical protein
VGLLSLDGNGNFTMNTYQYGSSGTQALSGSGTYTVGGNCALNLSFAKPLAGSTGALTPPLATYVLLGTPTANNTTNGLITIQPAAGQVYSGILISQ